MLTCHKIDNDVFLNKISSERRRIERIKFMSMVIEAYDSDKFHTEYIASIEIPSSNLEKIDYFFNLISLNKDLEKNKALFSQEVVTLGLDLYDGFLSKKSISLLVNNLVCDNDFDREIKKYLEKIVTETECEYILFSYS